MGRQQQYAPDKLMSGHKKNCGFIQAFSQLCHAIVVDIKSTCHPSTILSVHQCVHSFVFLSVHLDTKTDLKLVSSKRM